MTTKKVKASDAVGTGKVAKGRPAKPVPKQFSKSDYRVRFFVAEDIRTDGDGKPMLIGFYADDVVGLKGLSTLPTKENPILFPGLTFMFSISTPPGAHVAAVSIEPNGGARETKVVETQFLTTSEKSSFNIIARAQPLPIFQLGRQKIKLIVDGHDFSGSFELREMLAG